MDAATAACLEMCADKERALCARIDELKSKAVEVEEELRKFKDLEAKTQQAGCDTNDVRAKLSTSATAASSSCRASWRRAARRWRKCGRCPSSCSSRCRARPTLFP